MIIVAVPWAKPKVQDVTELHCRVVRHLEQAANN